MGEERAGLGFIVLCFEMKKDFIEISSRVFREDFGTVFFLSVSFAVSLLFLCQQGGFWKGSVFFFFLILFRFCTFFLKMILYLPPPPRRGFHV